VAAGYDQGGNPGRRRGGPPEELGASSITANINVAGKSTGVADSARVVQTPDYPSCHKYFWETYLMQDTSTRSNATITIYMTVNRNTQLNAKTGDEIVTLYLDQHILEMSTVLITSKV
jgi:hypothetical protein